MGIGSKSTLGIIATAFIINLITFCLPCFALTVQLTWNANDDQNLGGYNVYYKADSTLPLKGTNAAEGVSLIDVGNQTTAIISGLDPSHTYFFAVTAYDKSRKLESDYSEIISVPPIADLLPPVVSFTSPTQNNTVSNTVSVIVSASDNMGVTKVEFFVNDKLTATETTTPYLFAWNTTSIPSDKYILSARAYDAAGNMSESQHIEVNVVNDVVAPTVAIKAPLNDAQLYGTVIVSADASDNVGVTRVEFFVDGVLSAVVNTHPYSFRWNTDTVTKGGHTLSAKAYDAVGNIGTSALVGVQSIIPGDINNDGIVNMSDVLCALQFVFQNIKPTYQELQRGDIAQMYDKRWVADGIIDMRDILVIYLKAIGG